MPIRHCQLCGIKVIVDEDKASVFPFYCDLCSTKTQMGMSPSADAGSPPDPVTPPMMPDAAGTNSGDHGRLECPTCAAGLKVAPGSKPIKTRCPACATALVVQPSGEIRPIAEEDPLKFAQTQEIQLDEGTEGLKAKIREIIKREKGKTTTSSSPAVRPATAPPPPPKVMVRVPTAPPPPPRPPSAAPPPPPPPPRHAMPMHGSPASDAGSEKIPTELRAGFIGRSSGSGDSTESRPMPEESDQPPPISPEPPSSPREPTPVDVGGFVPTSDAPTSPEDEPTAGEEEEGEVKPKFVGPKQRRIPLPMAWILLVVPIVAAVVVPGNEPEDLKGIMARVGGVLEAGSKEIIAKLKDFFAPPPPPVEEAPPAAVRRPVGETPVPTPEEIVGEYRTFLDKVLRFASSDRDDGEIASLRDSYQSSRKAYDAMVDAYKKAHKTPPPTKAEERQELQNTLEDLHMKMNYTKNNINRARGNPEATEPLERKLQRIEGVYNTLKNDFLASHGTEFKPRDINDPAPPPPPSATREEMRQEAQTAYTRWKEQEAKVEREGAQASSLDQRLVTVYREQYEAAKRKYEADHGAFTPK